MPTIEAISADEAWMQAADLFRCKIMPRQNGRGGVTSELLHVVLQINNSRDRWVTSRSHPLSVAFAIVEVIGIVNGRKDSKYLNFFNPRLPKFAGIGAEYHGAYGFRLRANFGFDQLSRACDALTSNSEGRQVVLQIWDAAKDFPAESGIPVAPDIPCNVCSMLKIRRGKLEWSQIMRSNDLFKGLPYNLVQFTSLQEIVAGWIGIEPGTYTHFSDSLHIYADELEAVRNSVVSSLGTNSDSLAFPKSLAEPIWKEMSHRVDRLVAGGLSDNDLIDIATLDGAPDSFSNLMSIVVADAARRYQKTEVACAVVEKCSNPVLQFLWKRWFDAQLGKKVTVRQTR